MSVLTDQTLEVRFLITVMPRNSAGAAQTRRYGYGAFETLGGDAVPNAVFRNVVRVALTYEASLSADGGLLGGIVRPNRGEVVITYNDDTEELLDLFWDDAPVTVLAVAKGAPYSSAVPVFTGTCTSISYDTEQIRIQIASPLDKLDKALTERKFAGTGDREGGADLKDKTVPIGLGLCREVPVIWTDFANRIGILHWGAIQEVVSVKERGGALVSDGNYATYAALKAASITAGRYATCLAEGCIRLANEPLGLVTVSFRGDATGGVYASSAARIIERVMTTYLSLTTADYDAAAVTALHAANGAECGLWIPSGDSALSVITRFLNTVGAWAYDNLAGLITLERLAAPSLTGPTDAAAAGVFTGFHNGTGTILDLNRLAFEQPVVPPYRVVVKHQPIYGKPETFVTGADQTYFQNDWRTVQAEDTAIKTRHPKSKQVEFETLFDATADATAEATRRLALLGTERRVGTLQTGRNALGYVLGRDQLWLSHPKFRLTSGQAFRVVGLRPSPELGSVQVQIWG